MKRLFTDNPKAMQERMAHLEERDRQVPPRSGMLLALCVRRTSEAK